MSVRLLPEVSLSGPQKVTVGGRVFGVPASAGVRLVQDGKLAFVLFQAKVHALSNAGEISIPVELKPRIASAYFGGRQR